MRALINKHRACEWTHSAMEMTPLKVDTQRPGGAGVAGGMQKIVRKRSKQSMTQAKRQRTGKAGGSAEHESCFRRFTSFQWSSLRY